VVSCRTDSQSHSGALLRRAFTPTAEALTDAVHRGRYQRIIGKVMVAVFADPNWRASRCPKTQDAGLAFVAEERQRLRKLVPKACRCGAACGQLRTVAYPAGHSSERWPVSETCRKAQASDSAKLTQEQPAKDRLISGIHCSAIDSQEST